MLIKLNTTNTKSGIFSSTELAKKYSVSNSIISGDIKEIKKTLYIPEPDYGIITTIHETDVDTIWIKYETSKDHKQFGDVKHFPNRRIATVVKLSPGELDKIDEVVHLGMKREEILKFFPRPKNQPKNKGYYFNFTALCRSIVYEAYRREIDLRNQHLSSEIEEGDVRRFWYTHIKFIAGVLGVHATKSQIQSIVGDAWEAVVNAGIVTYEDMKIVSDSEMWVTSVVRDSPFANIINCYEKKILYNNFKWIPQLFHSTHLTSGGQPARTSARKIFRELKKLDDENEEKLAKIGKTLDEDKKIMNKDFHLTFIIDLDPAGYYIVDAYIQQFKLALEFYGGTGNIIPHILFVRIDQVTDKLLQSQGIPWIYGETEEGETKEDKKKKAINDKKRETQWEKFCEKTKTHDNPHGGLYLPLKEGWAEEYKKLIVKHPETGEPVVRGLLELDAFSTKLIEKTLLKELFDIIDDESKIMITEIMRIFDKIKNEDFAKELIDKWKDELIQPEIKKIKKPIKELNEEFEEEKDETTSDVEYIKKQTEAAREQLKRDRFPDEFEEKDGSESEKEKMEEERSERSSIIGRRKQKKIDRLYEELRKEQSEVEEEYEKPIKTLEDNIKSLDKKIDEECVDIDEAIDEIISELDDEIDEVETKYQETKEKIDKFEKDEIAKLNPIVQSLKSDIEQTLTDKKFVFRVIEQDKEIKTRISSLLVNPSRGSFKFLSVIIHNKSSLYEPV